MRNIDPDETWDLAWAAFERLRAMGFDALAIVLMHGWRFADHEARLAAIARGDIESVSTPVEPLIRSWDFNLDDFILVVRLTTGATRRFVFGEDARQTRLEGQRDRADRWDCRRPRTPLPAIRC